MIINGENTSFTLAEGQFIDKPPYEAVFQGIQTKLRLARLAFATEQFSTDKLERCGVHAALRNNGVFAEDLRALFDITMEGFDDRADKRGLGHPLHTDLQVPELDLLLNFALHRFTKAQASFSENTAAIDQKWLQQARERIESHPELPDTPEMKDLQALTSNFGIPEVGQESYYYADDMQALGDMTTASMIARTIVEHLEPPLEPPRS